MNYWCSCLSILPIYVFEAELIGVGGEEGENGRTNEVKRTGREEGLCQISDTERISEK